MTEHPSQTQNLEYLLAVASHRMRQALSSELKNRGISLEHWRVMNLLVNGEGRTMSELADAALLSTPTATRTIDQMVGEALIYRAPHAGDRRKVLVLLSDKGRQLWSEIKESANRCEQTIVEQYGDAWIKDLVARLGHLVEPNAQKLGRDLDL